MKANEVETDQTTLILSVWSRFILLKQIMSQNLDVFFSIHIAHHQVATLNVLKFQTSKMFAVITQKGLAIETLFPKEA